MAWRGFRALRWRVWSRGSLAGLALVLVAACGGGGDSSSASGPGGPGQVEEPASCKSARAAFANSVWPVVKDKCLQCHIAGSIAGAGGLVFKSRDPDAENLESLKRYAARNGQLLLDKSIGAVRHDGGKPLGNADSADYKTLKAFLPVLEDSNCPPPGANSGPTQRMRAFWQPVSFEAPTATLARAAVLLAGRTPTEAERAEVLAGGSAALRSTIRSYMQGQTFEAVLQDAGELLFLSPGVRPLDTGAGGLDPADWPLAAPALGVKDVPAANRADIARLEGALRQEPVQLLRFIVANERPFTDMVAGRYTVATGAMGVFLGAKFKDGSSPKVEDETWREATLPDARNGTREHAGVLSTHAWLQRFPTTATNRNRHRVYKVFEQFLATDIDNLAKRPLDDTNTQFKVPVVENPACAVCHNVIDPVAAGFQNWEEHNRFRPNLQAGAPHALPSVYLDEKYPKDAAQRRYYQPGDNWFRDQAAPGYGGLDMPGGYQGSASALQWTGQQVARDPRFAMGAVYFFYEGLFGRKPLGPPEGDPGSAVYANDLAAYEAQLDEFTEIAARFAKDQGRGAFNAKDLLVDLLTSRTVTARAVSGSLDPNVAQKTRALGAVYVLSPAQVNRRLARLVGTDFEIFRNPYGDLGLSYGEFDGVLGVTRAQQFSLMQSVISERMSLQLGCQVAYAELVSRKPGERLLFGSLTDWSKTPETPQGQAAVLTAVRQLHSKLWRHEAEDSDPEIQRTYRLFGTLLANRPKTPESQGTECRFDDKNDPTYAGRAWSAVLAYMLADPEFLLR